MDDSILTDLVNLLKYFAERSNDGRDPKPEVRQGAAEYICSLTSTPEGCKQIAEKQGHLALTKLLGDNIVFHFLIIFFCIFSL